VDGADGGAGGEVEVDDDCGGEGVLNGAGIFFGLSWVVGLVF
jgi:hypothetical protein